MTRAKLEIHVGPQTYLIDASDLAEGLPPVEVHDLLLASGEILELLTDLTTNLNTALRTLKLCTRALGVIRKTEKTLNQEAENNT